MGFNNLLKNSSLFLNINVSLTSSCLAGSRTDSISPSVFPFSRNLFILGYFNCPHPLQNSKDTLDPLGKEVFDWVISSDLLHWCLPVILSNCKASFYSVHPHQANLYPPPPFIQLPSSLQTLQFFLGSPLTAPFLFPHM